MINLDIDNSIVRLLETDNDRIVSWASREISQGLFNNGGSGDYQTLGEIIKELLKTNKIKEKKAALSITGIYSLTRLIVIPTPPGGVVAEQSVVEAVEDLLPVVLEDRMYIFWSTIGAVEGGQQLLVHVVPKEVIDPIVQATKLAGISIRTMELKPLALARMVNSEDGIILNIEKTSFDIIIITGGLAEIIRTSGWEPDALTREEQAEHLINAINTTVNFLETNRPEFPFSRNNPLFIFGQMSTDTKLVDRIRKSTGFAKANPDSILSYQEDFPINEYAVNIGLAMKDKNSLKTDITNYTTPDLNLLPDKYKPWRPTAKQVYIGIAFILALGLLVPMYRYTTDTMKETRDLQAEFDGINTLVNMRQQEIADRDPLKRQVDEIRTIAGMGKGFVADYQTITGIASDLGVTIPSISSSGSSVSFSCVTDSYVTFRDFITALEETGRFINPVVPPDGYPFITSGHIVLTVNPANR